MGYKKKINVFLGSSIVEFANERMAIENFIRNVSDSFEERYDIKIQPLLCENFDDAYSKVRKQEEYNQKIRESEFCFFIFFTKAGEYTVEEFETARKKFEDTGKPKIYTYFKVIGEGEGEESLYAFMETLDKALGHFYGTFSHIDTVKLRILMSLKLEEMDFLEIKAEGGDCVVDGKKVLSLKNVSEFVNNKSLEKLQRELEKVQEEYYALKPRFEKGNCDNDTYSRYYNVASRRQNLINEIEELQKLIFNLSLNMVKDSTRGEITVRQKEAYRLFELGDYDGCMSVLDSNEMDDEFLREEKRDAERRVARRRKYIREYKTKIEILTVMTGYEKRFEEITSCYEKIVPLAFEEKIELDVVYEYVVFLNDQGKNPISLMERLEKAYDSTQGIDDCEKACLFNLMGIVYKDQGNPLKAEEYYKKAIEIYEKLAEENFDRYSGDLADSYNNAGIFYKNQGNPSKAEEYYKKAIKIREKLAAENPKRYNSDLAASYFNFAIFTRNDEYFKKAYVLAKTSLHDPLCRQIIERLKGKFE